MGRVARCRFSPARENQSIPPPLCRSLLRQRALLQTLPLAGRRWPDYGHSGTRTYPVPVQRPAHYDSRRFELVFLQPGIGGQLAKFSARSNPGAVGMMFTGSRDTVSILHHYDWIFVSGIKEYCINANALACSRESAWKRRARKTSALAKTSFKTDSNFPADTIAGVAIREEHAFAQDLLPRSSPFTFRLNPSVEYLAWRYGLSLSFVRYRLFRITARGVSIGYVILTNARPSHRRPMRRRRPNRARLWHSPQPRGTGPSTRYDAPRVPHVLHPQNANHFQTRRLQGCPALVCHLPSAAISGPLRPLRRLLLAREFRLGRQRNALPLPRSVGGRVAHVTA